MLHNQKRKVITKKRMKNLRSFTTLTELETEIERIARGTKESQTQKIERIFDLGQPVPSTEERILLFGFSPQLWDVLKRNNEFWIDIVKAIGLPNYEEGRVVFGNQQIYERIDLDRFSEFVASVEGYTKLSKNEQITAIRQVFYNYMRWYDAEASIQFLVLYMQYLKIKGEGKERSDLVSLDYTKQHVKATRPAFKETVIPSATSTTSTTTTAEEVSPPLTVKLVENLYIGTTMTILSPTRSYIFILQMNKKDKGRLFTIRFDGVDQTIPTEGIITRILKFVSLNILYVVISGESDSILVRIQFTKAGAPFTTDPAFPPLNADLFDDLLYYDTSKDTTFATNMKSVSSFDELLRFDVSVLSGLKGSRAVFKDLTKAQKAQLQKQNLQEVKGIYREISEEEKDALSKLRKKQGRGVVKNDKTIFRELDTEELEYIHKEIGYIDLENMFIRYSQLMKKIVEPIVPVFRWGPHTYVKNDLEVLAVKLIHIPHVGSLQLFTLAVLVKKYTSNITWDTQLYALQYSFVNDTFKVERVKVLEVTDFLMDNRAVVSFNLIFHDTNFFYIQVIQGGVKPQQLITRNSLTLEFDFRYSRIAQLSGLSPQVVIKDYKLLNTLAHNGYRIYDFRHNVVPLVSSKFDAVFYKYDYERERARLIFYKAREDRPGIADTYIDNLSPNRIIAIIPIQSANYICYVQIRPSAPGKTSFFSIVGKQTSLLSLDDKFSLATQFKTNLTLETTPFCTFCGTYTHTNDNVTKNYYCNNLCQLLFCTTNQL